MADYEDDRQSSFKFPATPGMPLFALSPERVNIPRQAPPPSTPRAQFAPEHATSPGFGHPELGPPGDFSKFGHGEEGDGGFKISLFPTQFSPSQSRVSPVASDKSCNRLEFSNWSPPKSHSRTNSDVQGMVARFNSLDIRDHADMRKKDAAALKRAQMGREEAEEEVKKLREEARASKREIEEGRDRERRVMKRLDVVMEDLHRTKETQAHAQSLYEKEIRRARKEAFKSSSALVKLQEELKIARKALGVVQSDLDLERIQGGRREQDAFAAQYQLVGVQEELAQTQSQLKTTEEERNIVKKALKEEEVTRIAAEGKIALPASKGSDDELSSPKKQRPVKPSQTPTKEQLHSRQDVEQLKEKLESEVRRRELAEEEVEFLKMECQFGCCACKTAERQGRSFIHDGSFEAEVQKFKDAIASVLTPAESMATDKDSSGRTADSAITEQLESQQGKAGSYGNVDLSPNSGTLRAMATLCVPKEQQMASNDGLGGHMEESHVAEEEASEFGSQDQEVGTMEATEVDTRPNFDLPHPSIPNSGPPKVANIDNHPMVDEQDVEVSELMALDGSHDSTQAPDTPFDLPYRTVTTTIKVPLADASTPDYSAFCSPMKLTREEAIEQLRQRRGRARSVAGTPKKPGPEGPTPRRDISAPEVGVKGMTWHASKKLG